MGTASQSAKSDSRETEIVYRVEGHTKINGNPLVVANENINLRVTQGSLVGIFGPNGAGKTTLVRQMAGLLRPTQGDILLCGYNIVREPGRVSQLVGYYGQKVLALRAHKLHEVLYIAGLLRGQRRTEVRQQAREIIGRFASLTHLRIGFLTV
jgi:ABC-type multidrug transport system ATPase subunit